MSNLKNVDKLKLEKLFDMWSWYVLGFSNKTFSSFFVDSVNIDIEDSVYYLWGWSKANRLRWFRNQAPNNLAGKLIGDLLVYWKTRKQMSSSEITKKEKDLYDDCVQISYRLIQDSKFSTVEISNIINIDHQFIQENIKKCDKKISEQDYSWAITNARSLVETVLLYIQSKILWEEQKFDGELNALYKKVATMLNLTEDKNKKIDESLKKTISGLYSIISGMAELANDLGDRHGRAKINKTEVHHAIW